MAKTTKETVKETEECTHDCASCSANCSSRDAEPDPAAQARKEMNKIKKTIAVMSGKGGVGKSLVTALLASATAALGKTTAVLDADITGPSIPRAFGLSKERAGGSPLGILPVETATGIKVMSLNLLMENETDPVIWRGALITGCATQFYTDVLWGDVDYMFVDMPPGTGDVPLSVFQSLPLAGVVVVSTPQDLVRMIVEKALNMAKKMNIPVLGLVENMSYAVCPCCSARLEIFGQSKAAAVANEFGISAVARLPVDPELVALADGGRVEEYASTEPLEGVFRAIEEA